MDKQTLYNQAKDAYYAGHEIMSDLEFDQLEEELGLENKGYVGSISNVSYTVKHPVKMGSLSKIQIKKNDKDSKMGVNFNAYLKDLQGYMDKSPNASSYEITPKFDGSSIEVVYDYYGKVKSASTRGNGEMGKDILVWYRGDYLKNSDSIMKICKNILSEDERLIVRGECLIDLGVFQDKYQNDFANPRAWVAGCIGQKWEDTPEQWDYRNDLHFVFYTFIKYNINTGAAIELKMTDIYDSPYDDSKGIGEYPDVWYVNRSMLYNNTNDIFRTIYENFAEVRKNSNYALDGFVIKPIATYRLNNFDRERPEESVAIKFLPQILKSKIIDIKWKLGKTNEWFPTAILEPVYMDGKKIQRATLHNYNYLIQHLCGIGSEVEISLAGDIIPFVYKVVSTGLNGDNIDEATYYNLPENNKIEVESLSEIKHLMVGTISDDEERLNKFLSSAKTLNLNNIGVKTAEKLWKLLYENRVSAEDMPMFNITQLFDTYSKLMIKKVLGETKSTLNILDTLDKAPYSITLAQLIESCNFTDCGKRASERIAEVIYKKNHEDYVPSEKDFAGLSGVSWKWFFDKDSEQWQILMNLAVNFAGKGENIYNRVALKNKANKSIAVILTGGPEGMTKKEWLKLHPEYTETTKWNECQILFCNDLSSTSSKMKKAQKLGIEIKLYN